MVANWYTPNPSLNLEEMDTTGNLIEYLNNYINTRDEKIYFKNFDSRNVSWVCKLLLSFGGRCNKICESAVWYHYTLG